MAFPQTSAPTETSFPTPTTAHEVDMPGTVNSGDGLIILWAQANIAPVPSTPGGWSVLYSLSLGDDNEAFCYVKLADGTEGGTKVDIVTDSVTEAATQVYRITNWFGELSGIEAGTGATGSSTTPDPSPVTPSWGSLDNLWIAICHARNDDETVTGYPTNYDDNQTGTVAGGGVDDGATIGSATKETNASSDDPDTFTLSGTESWAANTIVIRPSSGIQILRRRREFIGVN